MTFAITLAINTPDVAVTARYDHVHAASEAEAIRTAQGYAADAFGGDPADWQPESVMEAR